MVGTGRPGARLAIPFDFGRPFERYIREWGASLNLGAVTTRGVGTLEVDGSYGEGGGQILRTAAMFSVIQGRPIHVSKIRSGRKVPGLRRQHLSALEILRAMSGGRLEGGSIGSSEVTFTPGTPKGGTLEYDLGTAASTTLVLQAVVPAAALSGLDIEIGLAGGTDVPWSPTFDYFSTVVKEAFFRIGIGFSASAARRGYYPRGGGRVSATVLRSRGPSALTMTEPGATSPVSVVSRCGDLPRHVARRQLDAAVSALRARGIEVGGASDAEEQSDSPGSSILVHEASGGRILGSDEIGARGKRAEEVGTSAAVRFADLRQSGACVDSNLADMLAPILALAKSESRLRVPRLTLHLETSLHVASLFTGCKYSLEQQGASLMLAITPDESLRQHNV